MVNVAKSADFQIEQLTIKFPIATGVISVIDRLDMLFKSGKTTGIIGESGCGKSVLGQALFGLLPHYAQTEGCIFYNHWDVLRATVRELQVYWRSEWGFIPQSPQEALNPIRNIKKHFDDIGLAAGRGSFSNQELCDELLMFGLEAGKRVLRAYPHELSGGMLQRLLCAMAVCCNPSWILADEPTKGLDKAAATSVYQNLQQLKFKKIKSMIVITHDLSLAKYLCDELAIMYAGEVVEINDNTLSNPLHPYTKAFLMALPEQGFQPMTIIRPELLETRLGCRFASRCLYYQARCGKERPELYKISGANQVRCFLYA